MNLDARQPQLVRLRVAELTVHPVAKVSQRDFQHIVDIDALTEQLARHGQRVPLLVRRTLAGYEVLLGADQVESALWSKRSTLLAVVCEATDAQVLELVGQRELQWARMNPLERSEYLATLVRPVSEGGCGLSFGRVARWLCRSRDWVRTRSQLCKLPDPWRTRLQNRKLGQSFAILLLPFLGNTAALAAIAKHQQANPRAWQTRRAWEHRLKIVAAASNKFASEAMHLAACWTTPHRVSGEHRGLSNAHIEERVVDQAEQLDALLVNQLTSEMARVLIAPYDNSPSDLRTIDAVVRERICELKRTDK